MAQRGEGSHRIVRVLLRKMRNPAAIERDPYALRLREIFRTATAREAVQELIDRALHGHDPLFGTIVRRCDVQGEMTEDVARDLYLSVRHFFRYRAAAIEAIAIALGRLEPPEAYDASGVRSDEALRALGYASYLTYSCDLLSSVAALRWYQRAVEIEPTSVNGWLGISSTIVTLLLASALPADRPSVLRRAADAVAHAESLQPGDPLVQAERSVLALWSQSPTRSVRALAENALSKDPRCAKAFYALGWSAVFEGELESARSLFRSASVADPASLRYPALDYTVLSYQRRFDEVIVRTREMLEIKPGNAHALTYLVDALNASERYDETVATLAPYVAAGRADHNAQAQYVRALALIGDTETARRLLARYRGPSLPRAQMLIALEEFDASLAAVADAQAEGDVALPTIVYDHSFDALRDDRRLKELMQRRSA